MALKFFTVPVNDDGAAAAAVNQFLSSHRILALDRRWVDLGASSFWALCVDYLEHPPGGAGKPGGNGAGTRARVDYREVLNDADFAVFSRLRQFRKEIAAAEAIPVYTVFTNEQLAKMVKTRATTKAALEQIAGVGDARIEKYGSRILEFLLTQWNAANEATGKSV